MSSRILLVEDEESLLQAVRTNLEIEGYEVETAVNGGDAIKKFDGQHFNLVVLDVMMPDLNGFEVCEKIRLTDLNTPILFLTAKDSADDKIKGLKIGGDDYLTKPFNREELLLRVKNLVRHSKRGTEKEVENGLYQFGNNKVNFITYEAQGLDGNYILTKKEVMLLKLLIEHQNQVVSRHQILQYVWGYDVFPSTRTIDNFILAFRKYFEKDPKNPIHFHSIRGVGYKFCA